MATMEVDDGYPSVTVRISSGAPRRRERLPGEAELAERASTRTSALGGVMALHPEPVTPGSLITAGADFMRGHGTYVVGGKESEEKSDAVSDCQAPGLYASVAGRVQTVNKLVYVWPLKTRYSGEVGDMVVGRVTEVAQRRWRIDANARLAAQLPLSGVILPGGQLRRRSEEDERAMRSYLREGDLVNAEVQAVMSDGSLSLHMRSDKYGKLGQGVLLRVSPSLVKRRKIHTHLLPDGVTLILGNNGLVWVGPTRATRGGFHPDAEPVGADAREAVARVRNCVALLSAHGVLLCDTTVMLACDVSRSAFPEPRDLLVPEVQLHVVEAVCERLLDAAAGGAAEGGPAI